MKVKRLRVADLFCGAGGFSEGCKEAGEALGYEVDLTAINHWPVAIDTHRLNHPTATSLCTGIDAVNPRDHYSEGELDGLLASPECTHHSQARGGKPINDQSRSSAWCVIRWAEAVCPGWIVIENVPEFQTWGPLKKMKVRTKYVRELLPGQRMRQGEVLHTTRKKSKKRWVTGVKVSMEWRPDPDKKGETFRAWLATLQSLGYKTSYRVICSADYGDPTTRKRLIIQAVRGRRKICWPARTHSKEVVVGLRRWVPAREIIDWALPSQSIFDRKDPLADKTLARIWEGLKKHGLKNLILPQHSSNEARSDDEPVPTLTTTSRGVGLVKPYIVAWDNASAGPGGGLASVDEPLSTVVTQPRHGVAEPYLVQLRGGSEGAIGRSAKGLDEPLGAVTANGTHHGIATPYLVNMKGKSNAADLDDPSPTMTAHARHLALAEPYLIKTANGMSRAGEASRAKSLDDPAPTICGERGDLALIEPSLLPQQSDGRLRPVSEPCPTVATAGAIALIEPKLEPFVLSFYSNGKGLSLHEPLPGVTTKDRFGLVRPIIEIDGNRYLLDIHFRMLQPHELALGQGFIPSYQFAGNKSETVKQIGNAVTRRMVRAVIAAVISQKEDVTYLIDDEEKLTGKAVAA